MKPLYLPIVIVIVVFLVVVIIRYVPGLLPGSSSGSSHHQWIYIDVVDETPQISDIDGNPIYPNMILTFQGDELIFANRTGADMTISFDAVIFEDPYPRGFTIEPGKRKIGKVIASPGNFTFGMSPATVPSGPPAVKVGDDP